MITQFARAALMAGCATIAFPALAEENPEQPASPGANRAEVAVSAGALAAAQDEGILVTGEVLYTDLLNSVKTPTPVIDVPQSISITTEEEILDRGFSSIGEIIDYTPGVNTSQGEGHRDSIVFRGIRSTADFFIDGMRDDVQYYRGLYNLQQVEILRGPNALLFGRGGTGGVLNRVTKKGELGRNFSGGQVAIDTFGQVSVQGDVNLAAGDAVAVRVNAAYEELANHRDFYDGTRIGFNPTARVQLGETTLLDLSYEFADHERFIDRGIPTGADGRPVEAFEDIVFGDPEENYTQLEAHLLRATLQQDFSDSFKGVFSAFYGDYDKVYSNFYASSYDEAETPGEATLDGYVDTTRRENLILTANLIGAFQTSGIDHSLLVGGEYIATDSDQDRFNAFWSTTEDDNEIFTVRRPLLLRGGIGINADGEQTSNDFSEDINDSTQVGLDVFSLYIQDEIALTDWLRVVAGGRFDSFDIEVFDVVGGERLSRKDEEFSPRGGVILKPQENLSIYASYSESFLPRSGEQFTGLGGGADALDPDTFVNLEAGVKWDLASGLSLTAAVFEIEQSSPQPTADDAETLVVIDSKTQGFELQARGEVLPGWFVTAGYSYLDGEQVDEDGPTGLRPRELPENMASIWNQVEVTDRFAFGIGVTHQGSSFANNSNTAILPSYTRIDAAAFYDVSENLRLQVNVENANDTLYFPNAHSTHQVTVGAPINARFAVTGRF
ncbi:TonB-dependent receptor [Erythrobacter sp.]|uniref:TonB-dependent receptor n=1 Tax=Erythrobacter sp. TaxID=1042 RepID=UPI003C76AA97